MVVRTAAAQRSADVFHGKVQEAEMKAIRSVVAVAALALWLGAASAPVSAEENTSKPLPDRSAEIYRMGDKFVVAISTTEGSTTLAVVEPAANKRRPARKGEAQPDIADLMRNGRVIYTIELATGAAAQSQLGELKLDSLTRVAPPPTAARIATPKGRRQVVSSLTRQQRARIVKQTKIAADALSTVARKVAAQ
jgi:hypothetical protein